MTALMRTQVMKEREDPAFNQYVDQVILIGVVNWAQF